MWKKIAMKTRYGSYEFLIMSFRLCNASSTFTTFMNFVFHDKLDEFMIIYINDILIFSECAKRTCPTLKVCVGKVEG